MATASHAATSASRASAPAGDVASSSHTHVDAAAAHTHTHADEHVGTHRCVIPGDDVTEDVSVLDGPIRLGSGLLQRGDSVIATRAGLLSFKKPNRFFVLGSHTRYVPAVGDAVVGVVVDRNPEYYRVRLNATSVALLPVLAFDGASKRNKPNLSVGAAVYARVAAVSKHLDPELTCEAPVGAAKKDWVTGESLFGELRDGSIVPVSTGMARRLAMPDCPVLTSLGASLPFEIAAGMNGLVWITANAARHIVAISNAVQRSEHLSDDQAEALVEALLPLVLSS